MKFRFYYILYTFLGVTGYQRIFVSSAIDGPIEDIAINVKMGLVQDHQEIQKIVAVAHDNLVSIMGYGMWVVVSTNFSVTSHYHP